jgi:SAM-dependent methyltransferase
MADRTLSDGTLKGGDTPEYWEQHWDRFSEATRLNPAQAFRRILIYRLLGESAKHDDTTLLDVGCGSGDQLEALGNKYPNAHLAGIDRSRVGLGVTAKNFPNALLLTADLEASDAVPKQLREWASHAVCSEVLEHIEDPVAALRNLLDYLKPGGRLVITVPGGPKSAFDRSIGHHRHYTAAQIRMDLQSAGYEVERAAGAGFPTFNLYRLVVLARGENLSKDISGRPSLLARAVMAVFRFLLKFWFFNTPWGWQIVACARKPAETSLNTSG